MLLSLERLSSVPWAAGSPPPRGVDRVGERRQDVHSQLRMEQVGWPSQASTWAEAPSDGKAELGGPQGAGGELLFLGRGLQAPACQEAHVYGFESSGPPCARCYSGNVSCIPRFHSQNRPLSLRIPQGLAKVMWPVCASACLPSSSSMACPAAPRTASRLRTHLALEAQPCPGKARCTRGAEGCGGGKRTRSASRWYGTQALRLTVGAQTAQGRNKTWESGKALASSLGGWAGAGARAGGECVERGELGCSKGQFQHGLLLPQHPWTPRPLAAELLPPAHGGLTSVWSSDHSSSSLRCQ